MPDMNDGYMLEQLRKATRMHKTQSDMVSDNVLLNMAINHFKQKYTIHNYKNSKSGGDNKYLVKLITKGLNSIRTHSTKNTSETIGWLLYLGVVSVMEELDSGLNSTGDK